MVLCHNFTLPILFVPAATYGPQYTASTCLLPTPSYSIPAMAVLAWQSSPCYFQLTYFPPPRMPWQSGGTYPGVLLVEQVELTSLAFEGKILIFKAADFSEPSKLSLCFSRSVGNVLVTASLWCYHSSKVNNHFTSSMSCPEANLTSIFIQSLCFLLGCLDFEDSKARTLAKFQRIPVVSLSVVLS